MEIDYVIFITLIAALIASFAQLQYKTGVRKRLNSLRDILGLARSRNVMLGLAGYFTSLAVYLFALSMAPLSVVYPTFASTFVFVAIISFVHLGERLPAKRIAGTLLILLGVLMVSLTV